MTFSDTAMMELGITQSTNIHNTRSLIRTLKYVLDILQTEEAFMVEEYKHTHTQQQQKQKQQQQQKLHSQQSKTIFVTNLHQSFTVDDLYELFGRRFTNYLRNNCHIVMDHFNNVDQPFASATVTAPVQSF